MSKTLCIVAGCVALALLAIACTTGSPSEAANDSTVVDSAAVGIDTAQLDFIRSVQR